MRYVVVGPGALGCLFASLLIKGFSADDNQVVLLDHNPQRARLISRRGLIYEKDNRIELLPVDACSSAESIENVDVLLFCVKSYDLIPSLIRWQSLLTPGTLLLFLQNGIGHLDLDSYTADAIPVYGTCSEGATLVKTGHTRHCGVGATLFGSLSQLSDHTHSLLANTCSCMQECGISASISDKIIDRLWAKLFINVGINALTGIHQVTNGLLLESEPIKKTMESAIHEATQVARANHIDITGDPLQTALQTCQATANNTSSMLQDIKNKRATEIDAINGAIVKEGKRLGIKTPVNHGLVQKIKAIEKSY